MRAVTPWVPLALLTLVGCGEEFDPKSLLNEYRVLGIQAEPAELLLSPNPAEAVLRTELRAFDFDPTSTDPSIEGAKPPRYAWSYCTASLGSYGEYRCLDAVEEHPIPGDGPTVTFDLAAERANLEEDLARLSEAYGQPLGLDTPEGVCPLRLPIQIRLRSGEPSIGEVETVRNLIVRFPGDPEAQAPNRNPEIASFRIAGFEACTVLGAGCFAGAPVGSPALKLEVELVEGASETYTAYRQDEDACTAESADEELLFSWYTSAGEVEFANTNSETLENRLKLPKSLPEDFAGKAMQVRVFVAVRDGRGGIDVAEGAFPLTDAKGE